MGKFTANSIGVAVDYWVSILFVYLSATVLLCSLMLVASLVKKSLKLLHFLEILGLSRQVSHVRLNNPVSLMANYSEQTIFFSVNGYSPALVDSLQSSMQVNGTTMVVLGSHFPSNAISLSCSFSGVQFHSLFGCIS